MKEVTFLRQPEVLHRLANMPKSTYNAGVKTGRYVPPIKLSERSAAYPKNEIDLLCLMLSEGYSWRERNDQAWLNHLAEMLACGDISEPAYQEAMETAKKAA